MSRATSGRAHPSFLVMAVLCAALLCAATSCGARWTGASPTVAAPPDEAPEVLGRVQTKWTPGELSRAAPDTVAEAPSNTPGVATTAPSGAATNNPPQPGAPQPGPPPSAPPAPPPAPPPLPPAPPAPPVSGNDLVAQAFARINLDWRAQLPGWRVEVLGPRRGFRGLTLSRERRIEIYPRASDTPESLAHLIAHEIGHGIDVERLGAAQRAAWAESRGFAGRAPWYVASGAADFASGAGDFAESVAWATTGATAWHGQLAGPPDAGQLALLALLVGT